MKRIPRVAVILSMFLLFSSRAFAGPFSDVPEGHWAYEAIEKLQKNEIFIGFDKRFFGENPITRYEMAVIISRLIFFEELRTGKEITLKTGGSIGNFLPTRDEFNSLKEIIQKLMAEFKYELEMLGVKVSAQEEKIKQLDKDVSQIKKFQWWGFIRVRGWRPSDGWDNIFDKGINDGSYVDQLSVLSAKINVNSKTQAHVSLSNRDFKQFNLGNSGFSNVIYSGWGDEKNAVGLTVYRAYVVTETPLAKFSIGRQHWKWGHYGLLVMAPLKGAFGNGAILAEKKLGEIKLNGVASLLTGNDKYLVGRASLPVKNGEIGLTYMALGPGAVKNSFGVDIMLGKFKAEAALLSYNKNTEPDNALGVVAGYDVVKNKKTTVNVKLASIDGQTGDKAAYDLKIPGTTRTMSVIGEEDAEGVFRVGFKGVGITATHKLNNDYALSAEINKGNTKNPVGFGKFTLTRHLSPSVDLALTLIQVGQNSSSRAVAVRGELFVKF